MWFASSASVIKNDIIFHQNNDVPFGQRDGEARILQRLLVARFGPLSASTLAQLEHASTAQIEAWVDKAITARSLRDIFEAP